MKVYESVDQLVGHTPLLELRRVEEAHEVSARILGSGALRKHMRFRRES